MFSRVTYPYKTWPGNLKPTFYFFGYTFPLPCILNWTDNYFNAQDKDDGENRAAQMYSETNELLRLACRYC